MRWVRTIRWIRWTRIPQTPLIHRILRILSTSCFGTRGSGGNNHLEPAPEHALAVHDAVRVDALHPRIAHHLLHDAVAVAPRLVDDPREPYLFTGLELHALR